MCLAPLQELSSWIDTGRDCVFVHQPPWSFQCEIMAEMAFFSWIHGPTHVFPMSRSDKTTMCFHGFLAFHVEQRLVFSFAGSPAQLAEGRYMPRGAGYDLDEGKI